MEIDGSGEIMPPPINNSSRSHQEIVEEEDDFNGSRLTTAVSEEYGKVSESLYNDGNRKVSDVVYVVTWTATEELLSASMDALIWTLGSDVCKSSTVCLVQVFPELRLRYIPTLLGRLPLSEANAEQIEGYVNQERNKRSKCLEKFISICSSSKVQVETVLIESDMEAKSILDLIPMLNIRKVVMGATKSNLRKIKGNNKKNGGGTIDQILHNAPTFCEVKVICEGHEVLLHDLLTTRPSLSPSSTTPHHETAREPMQDETNGFNMCSCFKL